MRPVLEGTVALVTGASSGIGAATAAALAAQGAAVALAARRGDRLDTLAADIREQGGSALVLECDVTDERQAAGAVERTVGELGRLDTLINNAGVMLLGPVAGAPVPEWQQMVQLNVLGLLYCAHAALPHLLRADTSARLPRRPPPASSIPARYAASCWPGGTWTAFPPVWVLCGDSELAEGSVWEAPGKAHPTTIRRADRSCRRRHRRAGLRRRLQLRLPPGHMVGLSVPGGYGMVPRSKSRCGCLASFARIGRTVQGGWGS